MGSLTIAKEEIEEYFKDYTQIPMEHKKCIVCGEGKRHKINFEDYLLWRALRERYY